MTLSVKFTVSLEQRARAASEAAARAVFTELNGRFQDAIGSKAWDWPRDTWRSTDGKSGPPRKKGKGRKQKGGYWVPRGKRNIVHRSMLKDSNPGPVIEGLKVTYRWAEPSATAVHEGAVIYPWGNRKRRVLLTARPWTAAVLGRIKVSGIDVYPMEERFKALWLRKFNA